MSTDMIWQTSSTSSADTERLGELLDSKLKGGEVIELRSDLGGGKTTFVRGLARGAGSENNVVSPTFTLNRIYQAGDMRIYHFDFYRLDDPGILTDQLAEAVNENRSIVVVEWADIVEDVLPAGRISIELKPVANDSQERQINIRYAEPSRELIVALETDWQESRP
jgi:tRNA threonylcarbamoyladenosine biosynthesis protein TsaE